MISEIVSPKPSEADRWVSVPERGTPASLGMIAWIAERVGRPLARLLLFPITIYFLITAHDGASGVSRIHETGARACSPLVGPVAPFLLFCRYDSGPRLSVAW